MPLKSRSFVVPLSRTLLFLTLSLWVKGDTYRPSSIFNKQSNVVSISPSSTLCPIRSLVECSRVCSSQSQACHAIVYNLNARLCLTFSNRFKRSTDVTPSQTTVYMEKYPPLPSQIIPSVNPSCTTSSPICMFMSADATVVAIFGFLYSVYAGPSTLTRGSLVANQPLSRLLVNYTQTSVDSCVGFNSGRTVYIVKDPMVYCYEYKVSNLRYVPCASWTQKPLTNVFGLVMGSLQPGPYLALGYISYLFQLSQIVDSNGVTYILGLGSPFARYPSRITSISETYDPNIYLMASSGYTLYAYYYLEKSSVLVGRICV